MSKKAYIMIGLPGSGKSTKAKELVNEYAPWDSIIHSTDDYFMKDGVYDFRPNLLGVFHKRNLEAFKESIASGLSCVVVDNTNIRSRDRKPYVAAARSGGYEVEELVIGEFTEDFAKVCFSRNAHGVPFEAIMKMASKIQLPS